MQRVLKFTILSSCPGIRRHMPVRFVHAVVATERKDVCSNFKFQEQQIEIKTCGKLYEKWRERGLFSTIPDGDLAFTVRYIDTLTHGASSTVNNDSPVVLALHGAPGTYEDFTRMTSFLCTQGVRVISPCFPDFTDCKPGIFRHSASERAQFIKDFLAAIDVSFLDLLICHSSAVYPGLKLCVENMQPRISGLALLNPAAYLPTMRLMQPWPAFRAFVKMGEYDMGLQLLKKIGPTLLKLANAPVQVEHILDPLLSATVMYYGGIKKSRELYVQLCTRKFPIFLAFSEDDKLVHKNLSYKIAYKIGVQDPHIFHFDECGTMDKEGKVIRKKKVLAFEQGSHYVFSKHSEVINNEIRDFLFNEIV